MLSIEQCRKLINDNHDLPDEDILQLRKELYDVAQLAFEVYFEKKKRGMDL